MTETDLLVIVPHEDDELAIAGAMIYGAVQQKMNIKVVFVTNGDYYRHEGIIRIREAEEALGELGVAPENIIFLGYGDQTQTRHLYNSVPEEIVASYNGNIRTYGTDKHPEFAMTEYGVHHAYTRANYKNDIKAVIQKFYPSILVTTDWDNHMDHLALSLMVDEVLGELLREDTSYHPLVLKAQAYNGKWEGHPDYYSENNVTELVNEADGTDYIHPLDKWEERIRFSVPDQCKTALLKRNILYKAARKYRSQSVDLKAIQFINLDMVYWRRPTESLSYRAKIETSSGNAAYLNDFKCADCSDIIHGMWVYDAGIWIPEKTDTEKKIVVTLEKKARIREIHLFENPDEVCIIHRIKITFGNGCVIHTGELNHDGSRTVIKVPEMELTERVELVLEEVEGSAAGLTEIEIYETIREIEDYRLPLPLWNETPENYRKIGNFYGCRMEQKWFKFVSFGRVRLWPDKYFLMKRYPELKEKESFLVFWKAYFRFVSEKLSEKKKQY